jgi:hypothetical protein
VIVGPGFIWLHFPKTAGTETEAILRRNFGADPALAFDAIDPNDVIWHDWIAARRQREPGFEVGGRQVICNIRRLPEWLLSRVHGGVARTPGLKVTRAMFIQGRFLRHDGVELAADDLMRRYTAHPVAHWIRTEHFADDFKAAFGPFLRLDRVDLAAEQSRRNAARIDYIRDIDFYFTRGELRQLYRANPVWAALEQAVYGTLRD